MKGLIDKRLLREIRPVSGFLLTTIGLGIVTALLAVAQARAFSEVVAKVFLSGATLANAWNPLLWILGILLVRGGVQTVSEMTAHEAAIRIKEDLRERFLLKLFELGPIYSRGERVGELVNTAIEGIEALEDYFARYLPQLASAVFIPILILGFVFPLDFGSALILLVTGPLIPLFMILIGKLAEKRSLHQWQSLSRMSAHFYDMLQGLTTLKVFGRSKDQARVIGRVSDSYRQMTLSVLKIAFLSAFVLEFLATISTALVAVALGLRLVYGKISFQEALFLLLMVPEFFQPLRTLGLQFHAGLSGANAAQRIYEVLNLKVNEFEVERSLKGTENFFKEFTLTFNQVFLSYEEDAEPALKGLDFEIHSGQQVALVGPSGAGKSSILSLLMRFIEPSKGDIRISGISLEQIPLPLWRTQIAYVSQHPYLFRGTIGDNIRLARPEASEAEVIMAAQKAAAHDFILNLPQGYQTLVGEGGAGLSGGQAQRIALARAFLKNAPFLLLDEATESLDGESEHLIQEALRELIKGRTVLMIAHRIQTVYQADQILVVDQGRIAEAGTHQELLKQRGLYSRFIQEYQGGGGAE